VTTWTVPAEVVRVIDGDTLVCTSIWGGGCGAWAHVRLARVQRSGAESAGRPGGARLRARLLADSIAHGQALPSVTIISHSVDKYGRTLADVIVPDGALGFNLNDLLLSSGHAVPM
jgi:endonuclease YncB( thermonuclease family)